MKEEQWFMLMIDFLERRVGDISLCSAFVVARMTARSLNWVVRALRLRERAVGEARLWDGMGLPASDSQPATEPASQPHSPSQSLAPSNNCTQPVHHHQPTPLPTPTSTLVVFY